MATKKRKRRRRKALGDTDQPVVILQNRNRKFGSDLLKTQSDDSVLKTVVTWSAAAFVAYYGGTFLLGSVQKRNAENVLAKEEDKAATTTNTAAALAGRLKLAIADYGNTDEQTIWDIFEGKLIQSKEYFNEVAISYKIQTKGRVLINDLYNNLDSWAEPWKPDWNRLKPTLDKIMLKSRATFKKAKSVPKSK